MGIAEAYADQLVSDSQFDKVREDVLNMTISRTDSYRAADTELLILFGAESDNPANVGSSRIDSQREQVRLLNDKVDFAYRAATCIGTSRLANADVYNEDAPEYSFPQLVRDIFGNPFRPVSIDPRWLTSSVLDLAAGIYEDRAFERMPILADALMDAGCADEQIINHCRGPGPHVRGCWVVDLILGKS